MQGGNFVSSLADTGCGSHSGNITSTGEKKDPSKALGLRERMERSSARKKVITSTQPITSQNGRSGSFLQ